MWNNPHFCLDVQTQRNYNFEMEDFNMKNKQKLPFVYKDKLYFVTNDGKIYEKHSGEVKKPSEELKEVSKMALNSAKD